MRPIDADALYEDMLYEMCGTGCQDLALYVIRRAPTIAPPPNNPLTLEELWEMGEDWAWIELLVPLYGMGSGYYINHPRFSDVDKFCCGYPGVVIRNLPYSGYGDIWIAYRRKPEEVE